MMDYGCICRSASASGTAARQGPAMIILDLSWRMISSLDVASKLFPVMDFRVGLSDGILMVMHGVCASTRQKLFGMVACKKRPDESLLSTTAHAHANVLKSCLQYAVLHKLRKSLFHIAKVQTDRKTVQEQTSIEANQLSRSYRLRCLKIPENSGMSISCRSSLCYVDDRK